MTENEKRILDALSRSGSLSKRDLTSRCGIGWATAVKMVARLEEQGYIRPEGVERQKNSGVSPTVYTLSPAKPVALGIDVEYRRVRASIRNLRGEIMADLTTPTPDFDGPDDLVRFLCSLTEDFSARARAEGMVLEGIGIGAPNHLFRLSPLPAEAIRSALEARFGLKTRVDNNVRCLTHAVARFEPTGDSILVVTIRSGIGVGIVIDGKVYQGERGRAGELGHIPVDPDGPPCRCGRRGCLETIVNREVLSEKARAILGRGEPVSAEHGSAVSSSMGGILPSLFAAAKAGDPRAVETLTDTAGHLGRALARLLLVMDIRSIILYAAFGPDGDFIVPLVEKIIGDTVYPGLDFSLRYRELDDDIYVTGAAYLILRDYVENYPRVQEPAGRPTACS